MNLTNNNYHSQESNLFYMSCSQYRDFTECGAKTAALLRGEWAEPSKEEYTVGNYFHSYFEGEDAFAEFCESNSKSIYKSKGGKYAAFEKADEMIRVAESDSYIKGLISMEGMNEAIMTGSIGGVDWKIKLDRYIPEHNIIIDYKTAANLYDTRYNPDTRTRENFIEGYGYMTRAAVYSEIVKQFTGITENPHFILIVITKQEFPDKAVFSLNDNARWESELERVKENLSYILGVKNGEIEPERCGKCNYCRATKKITEIISYDTFTQII